MSVVARFVEKLLLDSTACVIMRHPCYAGGLYYCVNAVMTHVACFVAAALYSTYYTGTALDNESYSATSGNYTANTNNTLANASGVLPANGTAADYAGATFSKMDDFSLFVFILTLSAVWTVAFVGLLLTMNREYIGTFVSLQTGCAFSRAHFLDHAGDDARRINIFFTNEPHWRSIRDLVRQWVLGAYATWLLLSPAWLNNAVRALIPDDFIPAPAVPPMQQPDAQALGGRRQCRHDSRANMGMLRRVSLSFVGAEVDAAPLSTPAVAPEATALPSAPATSFTATDAANPGTIDVGAPDDACSGDHRRSAQLSFKLATAPTSQTRMACRQYRTRISS